MVADPAEAQSLAIESGLAGVENHNASGNLSFSLYIPLNDRLDGTLMYTRWAGTDHNLIHDLRSPNESSEAPYYGNEGLNVGLQYALINSGSFSTSLGAALGQYERVHLSRDNVRHTEYSPALTGSIMLRYHATPAVSPFIKGTLSTTEFDSADWAFLSVGVAANVF